METAFNSRDWYKKRYEGDKRYTAGADDFESEYSLRNSEHGLPYEIERIRQFFTLSAIFAKGLSFIILD